MHQLVNKKTLIFISIYELSLYQISPHGLLWSITHRHQTENFIQFSHNRHVPYFASYKIITARDVSHSVQVSSVSLTHHDFACLLCCYYWMQKIRCKALEKTSNSIMAIPYTVKIGLKCLKVKKDTHIHTQLMALISAISFYLAWKVD